MKKNAARFNDSDNAPRSVEQPVTSNGPRSDLPLDPRLHDWMEDVESSMRMMRTVGRTVLLVMAVIAVVLLWPWLSA